MDFKQKTNSKQLHPIGYWNMAGVQQNKIKNEMRAKPAAAARVLLK